MAPGAGSAAREGCMPFSRGGGSPLSASLPDSRRKELQPLPAKVFHGIGRGCLDGGCARLLTLRQGNTRETTQKRMCLSSAPQLGLV